MTFICAELGVNWRNLDEADKMIMDCAHAGVDAIKFQMYLPEHVKGHPRECELTQIILTESDMRYLYWRCKAHGVEFMCTPFYEGAVDILNPFVERWKIRHLDCFDYPIIKACEKTGKPMLISGKNVYCCPEYPPAKQPHLSELKGMEGYSCHIPNVGHIFDVAGFPNIEYLEVHVKRDVYDPPYCPIDNAVSITITELEELVERLR